jgi:hypothetical protein
VGQETENGGGVNGFCDVGGENRRGRRGRREEESGGLGFDLCVFCVLCGLRKRVLLWCTVVAMVAGRR